MFIMNHKLEVKDVIQCRGLFSGNRHMIEYAVIIKGDDDCLQAVQCHKIKLNHDVYIYDETKGSHVILQYSDSAFSMFGYKNTFAVADKVRELNPQKLDVFSVKSANGSEWKQIDDRDLDRILHWNDSEQKEKEFKYNDRLKKAEEVLGSYDSDDDYELDME